MTLTSFRQLHKIESFVFFRFCDVSGNVRILYTTSHRTLRYSAVLCLHHIIHDITSYGHTL